MLGVWASQPLAGAEDVNICGTVAVARQMTAPPVTEPRTFPVGRHRSVTTQVGAREITHDVVFETRLTKLARATVR